MTNANQAPIENRLREIADRLCEVSSLMTIICIATAEMTETPECMLTDYQISISPALDSINRTLGDLWGIAENLAYDYKLTLPPTTEQKEGTK